MSIDHDSQCFKFISSPEVRFRTKVVHFWLLKFISDLKKDISKPKKFISVPKKFNSDPKKFILDPKKFISILKQFISDSNNLENPKWTSNLAYSNYETADSTLALL